MPSPEEFEIRVAALRTRLRIEEFAFKCLSLAAPYLNDEDKLGWKAGDVLKFLKAEIDPHFLDGRKFSVSQPLPSSEDLTEEDFEGLDWSEPSVELDVNLNRLVSAWNSMGQLLHLEPKATALDIDAASGRIARANKFCDKLDVGSIFLEVAMLEVDNQCSEGHKTKRNAKRLKIGQVIPCLHSECRSVFIVRGTDPLVWPEFRLQIECGNCGSSHFYQPKDLVKLSYWEQASVPCLSEACDNRIQVQWVLCKAL